MHMGESNTDRTGRLEMKLNAHKIVYTLCLQAPELYERILAEHGCSQAAVDVLWVPVKRQRLPKEKNTPMSAKLATRLYGKPFPAMKQHNNFWEVRLR